MKKRKRKKYIPVVLILGSYNTKMEFGVVENPTFDNDIYISIVSKHKGGSGDYEMRTDEALIHIQGLAACIRKNLTGVQLVLKENVQTKKAKNKRVPKTLPR